MVVLALKFTMLKDLKVRLLVGNLEGYGLVQPLEAEVRNLQYAEK
ncbi:hypothetical protein NVP1067O_64 [Vibrio phage 1.067.O._10N.261.52.C9]|nr:hypothetical protein NVP1067O_64 [Vibrio phage 1.067.O._10N.261.52.C9]